MKVNGALVLLLFIIVVMTDATGCPFRKQQQQQQHEDDNKPRGFYHLAEDEEPTSTENIRFRTEKQRFESVWGRTHTILENESSLLNEILESPPDFKHQCDVASNASAFDEEDAVHRETNDLQRKEVTFRSATIALFASYLETSAKEALEMFHRGRYNKASGLYLMSYLYCQSLYAQKKEVIKVLESEGSSPPLLIPFPPLPPACRVLKEMSELAATAVEEKRQCNLQ